MSANNNSTPSAITGKPKKPAKRLASSSLIPVGETSFVAELAVVSRHDDLDYDMQDAPQPVDVKDEDVIMVDAPDLKIEPVPELDSVEAAITDPDTVMEDAPPLN